MLVFAVVVAPAPFSAGQADEDAFPPFVLNVSDVTGDGVTDVVAGQSSIADPRQMRVRFVNGADGRVVWDETVRDLVFPFRTAALEDATGLVVTNRLSDGTLDPGGHSLRVRIVDSAGVERWARTFTARTVVGDLFPTYVRPALRGVLRRPGGSDLLLVEWSTRVEGGAGRVTRIEAELVDAATGTAVATHGPFDTVEDHAELRPVPAGDADAFGVLTMPPTLDAGPGSFTVRDPGTGDARWTAEVRAGRETEVLPMIGGDPPRTVVSVTSFVEHDVGVQLLDAGTGERVVDRARGTWAVLADGTGAERRLRTWYFTDKEGPNGYAVELLDLVGNVVRSAAFPVGGDGPVGTRYSSMAEAGDVDGDGWADLLVHVAYAASGRATAYDDRLVDGRTLRSRVIARDVDTLVWTGPRSAAVDGAGDDVYAVEGRTATVLDGATLRPLLRLSSADRVGALFGVRDGAARCADVVVPTFDSGGFALTRVGPRGEVRWSTQPGNVRVRDVGDESGCPRRTPGGRGAGEPLPRIPATGGLPVAALATLCAAGAVLVERGRRSAARLTTG